jgi:glutamine synthetase
MVDLKFMDFVGMWQHFPSPRGADRGDLRGGLGFDGSSIRGWQPIHASDMMVVPDPATATIDPFMKDPTLSLICNIVDPVTREPYSRDPRHVRPQGGALLEQTGIGDRAYFGPEAEFFIFDGVSYDASPNGPSTGSSPTRGSGPPATSAGAASTARRDRLPAQPRLQAALQGGLLPVAPTDSLQDLRTEMCG